MTSQGQGRYLKELLQPRKGGVAQPSTGHGQSQEGPQTCAKERPATPVRQRAAIGGSGK